MAAEDTYRTFTVGSTTFSISSPFRDFVKSLNDGAGSRVAYLKIEGERMYERDFLYSFFGTISRQH